MAESNKAAPQGQSGASFSFANLFGKKPAPTPAPATTGEPSQPAGPQSSTLKPSNNLRDNPQANKTVEQGETPQSRLEPTNPLDEFGPLWENTPNSQPSGPQPLFKPDMGKFQDAVGKLNFAESLPQELVTKALGGDAASFGQAVNTVAQQAFGKAILLSGQMMEKALEKRLAEVTKQIDTRVNSLGARDKIRSENPAFSHSAVAPMLDFIQSRIQAKYPEASPDQIKQAAMAYMSNVAGLFNKPAQSESVTPSADENAKAVDFSDYFDVTEGADGKLVQR